MMQEKSADTIVILVVEDNPGDARLIKEVINGNKIFCKLYIVSDGVEAMEFLNNIDKYGDAPRPDLIFLDLNLPRKDGREVLAEIKNDDHLKQIPVVVMTTSQSEEDILKSYSLHANCYVTKPLDLNQFIAVIKSIEDFWFSLVKLPHIRG